MTSLDSETYSAYGTGLSTSGLSTSSDSADSLRPRRLSGNKVLVNRALQETHKNGGFCDLDNIGTTAWLGSEKGKK